MDQQKNKKVFFASDFHLGVDALQPSKNREEVICKWLESIQEEAKHIYLLGDIFDYWFEYRNAIPKGFSKFLATLRRLRDLDIGITFFTGNHDMWMFDYFPKEYGIDVFYEAQEFDIDGKKFLVGHGDGLGPGDLYFKFIKKVFSNRTCQKMFSWIHPNIALTIMKNISQRDAKKYIKPLDFDKEKEFLIQYANEYQPHIDYFIFGHRHIAYDIQLDSTARILNLGDWISYNSYAVWDGKSLHLGQYGDYDKKISIISR